VTVTLTVQCDHYPRTRYQALPAADDMAPVYMLLCPKCWGIATAVGFDLIEAGP
jgi:hypothetical protein